MQINEPDSDDFFTSKFHSLFFELKLKYSFFSKTKISVLIYRIECHFRSKKTYKIAIPHHANASYSRCLGYR